MRFVLARERDNLRLAFREASILGQLDAFYRLLAMRQVLTVPPGPTINRSWPVRWTPKVFIGLPLFVQLCVTVHDLWTARIGFQVMGLRTYLLLLSEVVILGWMAFLTWRLVRGLIEVDDMWEAEWARLRPSPPGPIIQKCQADYNRLVYEELPKVRDGTRPAREWFKEYWGHQFNQWNLWKRGDIDDLTFSFWMVFRHSEWRKHGPIGEVPWQQGWEWAVEDHSLRGTDFVGFMEKIFDGSHSMLRPYRFALPRGDDDESGPAK
jgi:hypothetical protein